VAEDEDLDLTLPLITSGSEVKEQTQHHIEE